VRACKERVLTFAARQTEQSIRLGYCATGTTPRCCWPCAMGSRTATACSPPRFPAASPSRTRQRNRPAISGPSRTAAAISPSSDENNYTIWAFLKKCHSEGFLYRGHDVMPWCGRCGTGLSQMEVAEAANHHPHLVFVRFPIRARKKTALLVWTTTPWTLTSNVASAVIPS